MSKADNLHDFLQDVSDAIKEKKGSNEPINAQSFSEEIRNIPSGSPFAVDFGEEIASGNAAYLNVLQEDVDYYNEIQRKRANGEVTDEELLNDWVFKSKIAWYPKGMSKPNVIEGFRNLKVLKLGIEDSNVTQLKSFNDIECLILGGRNNFYGLFGNPDQAIHKVIVSDDVLEYFDEITIIYLMNNSGATTEINLKFVPIKDARSIINNKWIQVAKGINLSRATNTTGFGGGVNLITLEIYGLGISLSINGASILSADSVKYILDNCQEKASAYTLTLHADVKAAFLAKCDEDAEYAASLAAANAKGLTIA